jgi:hypothetical protein
MARPLKVESSGNQISLKEMTDSDIEYITYRVLVDFANTQSGTGTINLNGNGTQIGTFNDTSRPYSIGQHPIGTNVDTNTVVFYQERGSVTPNPSARPVIWTNAVKSSTDAELNSTVIANAITKLVNGGIGSYSLSTSIPTNGTWIEIESFTDTAASGNTTYTLYRKINDSTPTTIRPLKTQNGGLREMSDSEISSLVDNLRSFISDTGIGYYELQSSAPSGGTYINIGSVTDTRNQVANENYVGAKNYVGSRNFTRFFAGNNEGTFTGTRTFTGTSAYSGLTLQSSTETVGTVRLWLRQS